MFRKFNSGVFDKIYKRFHRPVLKFVRTRISDPEIASDLVQEVFLKLFRFRESYDPKHEFSTWLWTIARNTVTDYLRGVKGAPLSVSSDDLPSLLKNAEVLLLKKDQRRGVLRLLKKSLTRMQKRVLWLRVIHQLSYEEIANRLDLSLTAVKNLAHRARLNLDVLHLQMA